MTEQNVNEDAPHETTAYVQNRDDFLTTIVRLSNAGLGIGLTVIIEGAVVSGTLIDGKKYYEQLGKHMAGGSAHGFDDNSLLAVIGKSFSQRGSLYEKPVDAADDWEAPANYLHLENAKVYAPGGSTVPGGQGMLFRAKLNAVSGFTLGSIVES